MLLQHSELVLLNIFTHTPRFFDESKKKWPNRPRNLYVGFHPNLKANKIASFSDVESVFLKNFIGEAIFLVF